MATMTTILAAVLALGAAPAQPRTTEHALAGLRFRAPVEAEVTVKRLDEGAQVVAVTRDEEVLLIVVYQGKRVPSAKKALSVHRQELEDRLRKLAQPDSLKDKTLRVKLLRKWAKAAALQWVRWVRGEQKRFVAQVMAVKSRRRTVVVTWTAPRRGMTNAMAHELIKSVAFEKAKRKRGSKKAR